METEVLCTVLADGEYNFAFTLESKALKKQSNKEVFEGAQNHLKIALEDPDFIENNEAFFDEANRTNRNLTSPKADLTNPCKDSDRSHADKLN